MKLQKLRRIKKTVFLVITDNAVDAATIIENSNAASKLVKQSTVIELNRDETDNANLVTEYGLSGAPLPLVIVIANNGLLVGGIMSEQATTANLVYAVPSPKYLEVMTALSEGKSVFLIAYKKSAKDKAKASENCLSACSQLDKSITIELNVEDEAEAKLVKLLSINETQDVTTVVINASGQITGNYTEIPDATKLVEDATKVIKTGCCPGNDKSKCN
jgi:hypothetical protein